MESIKPNKLAELLAKMRAAKSIPPTPETSAPILVGIDPASGSDQTSDLIQITNHYGQLITLNLEQSEFVRVVLSGVDCCLIGAAGTGKTTCTKAAIQSLILSPRIPTINQTDGHKHLVSGTPGIVCVSFTRRAVRNLKLAMDEGMKSNCITIHKLLEYSPVYYTVFDEETGEDKTTMRFEPTRTYANPLPSSIKVCVIDEGSMVSTDLEDKLRAALPPDCQFIYLGDLNQLPPVFGSAILGYKLLESKVVELTQVYRQALESPIIELATSIRRGEPQLLYKEQFSKTTSQGKLTIHPWKKKLHSEVALLTAAKFFTQAIDHGGYDPEEDMILTPFNKSCGTVELNKHIAQHLARKRGAVVYEIVAGFNKHYLSVGDLVLCDKEDAKVIAINSNATYLGKRPVAPSQTLDYWGYDPNAKSRSDLESLSDLENIDAILEAASADVEEKVNVASHNVVVQMLDSGEEVTLDTAAEINSLILSYALTGHKAQGSEWSRVFILLHQSHNVMLTREWLYTSVTRARNELYIICEPEHIQKGTVNPRIKGDTLAAKAEYFKGKIEANKDLIS